MADDKFWTTEVVHAVNFPVEKFLDAFGIGLPRQSGLVIELKLEVAPNEYGALLTLKRYVTHGELDALLEELKAGNTNLQSVRHSGPEN